MDPITTNKNIIIQDFGLKSLNIAAYQVTIPPLSANQKPIVKNDFEGKVPQGVDFDATDYPVSQLNTPVWDSLEIKGGSYAIGNNTTRYHTQRFDATIITISQNHNVILTSIQGRDGEVIEYIGKSSFRINVKGGIFSSARNTRPISLISNFQLMMNSNQPLIINSCKFLSEWEITELVILDKSMPQVAGGYSYQLFEFNAIQNTSVLLAQSQVT